jgi:hypothetical protein
MEDFTPAALWSLFCLILSPNPGGFGIPFNFDDCFNLVFLVTVTPCFPPCPPRLLFTNIPLVSYLFLPY